MKNIVLLTLSLVLFCSSAAAGQSGYEFSLGYGQDNSKIDIYRVGVKKEFTQKWKESASGYFSGYFELSCNRWEYDGKSINGIAFSPVFAYYFLNQSKNLEPESVRIQPYIEGGIGAAYIDDYHIAGRNLSTNFQFEDRIGIGVKIRRFDLNFRYMHYSNASTKQPNDGIDIFIFTTSVKF